MTQSEERPEPLEVQLLITARSVRRAYDDVLAAIGVNMTESGSLQILAEHGPLAQRELADRLYIGRASAGACVDSLEAGGYVERRRSARDGRVWEVTLTPAGMEMARTCAKANDRLRNTLRDGIAREDQSQLVRTLARIRANARTDPGDPVSEL